MKITTWNINGIRAREVAMLNWIQMNSPDVLFLQEVKAVAEQIPKSVQELSGYEKFWNGSTHRGGYSGTGILVHQSVIAKHGAPKFSIPDFDIENRLVQLELGNLLILGSYVPRGEKDDHYALKLKFFDTLKLYLELQIKTGKDVIFCGDINVAHKPIDLHESHQKETETGFRPPERAKIDDLLSVGFADIVRDLNPDKKGMFTWWPYWKGARDRNLGWRIDCFYVSPSIVKSVSDSKIYSEEKSSDHAPVEITLNRA